MKKSFLNNCLIILLVICTSFIAFYSFNLLTSTISNYEAISQYSLAGIPMFMLYGSMVTMIVFLYRFYRNQVMDFYMIRTYTLIVAIMSLIGLTFGIIIATPIVYGSILAESIFKGYPLIMIIILSLFLITSLYFFIMSNIVIKRDNLAKPEKGKAKYRGMTFGVTLLLTYALGRFGALLYLPIYWSPLTSAMLIPFYIELSIPLLLVIFRSVFLDFNKNIKFSTIASGVMLAFSLLSFVHTILTYIANQANVIQALSPIFQIERLICIPVDFVVLYAVGIILPLITFIVSLRKMKKQRIANELANGNQEAGYSKKSKSYIFFIISIILIIISAIAFIFSFFIFITTINMIKSGTGAAVGIGAIIILPLFLIADIVSFAISLIAVIFSSLCFGFSVSKKQIALNKEHSKKTLPKAYGLISLIISLLLFTFSILIFVLLFIIL